MTFDHIALQIPSVLLPRPGVDLRRWAVIACDQYTSEPDYWQEVAKLTAGHPSTLELIFPEVYLEEADGEGRIAAINQAMARYLADGTLTPQPPGFVLLDRKTAHAPSRKGLMVALDLEHYDYRPGATSLIRATEGTILDRLPPRIKVREAASIELPHIMVLIDDPGKTVIEPLFEQQRELLYDTELMQGGGHLRGWRVADAPSLQQVAAKLTQLIEPAAFNARYGVSEQAPVLYAMGDGNHSFATAKAIWEQLKAAATDPATIMDHPARYALVELVNLHDPGLEFEAIHRVLFGADLEQLTAAMSAFFQPQGSRLQRLDLNQPAARDAAQQQGEAAGHHVIPFIAGRQRGLFVIEQPALQLTVASLQAFLDGYLHQQPSMKIDYIHGDDAVASLGGRPGNIGFTLPALSKHALFKTIILDGALPRKTFSMGEADEKRFYLECRRIIP
ncbi:MAG: DUF1015 domain-containing protein [Trichloromonadaceae bacterium]